MVLTIWAESEGPSHKLEIGNRASANAALIIYSPDPFYNLDQQICESFAKGLADNGWKVTIATIAAAMETRDTSFRLYVFCANTYNWRPDWGVTYFIKQTVITDKNVVAITLGAGSTGHSKKVFENIIKKRKGKLIDSKSFWLWRPNDFARSKESNVTVAVDIAKKWGNQIAIKLK